jgi:threonine dehydratase
MLTTRPATRISTRAIEEARGRIRAEFLDSRQLEHDELSRAVGARLLCKIEIENPTGSFKGRGADSFVNALAVTPRRLVAASAGNFGLALAYAARTRGVALTVYAAETASIPKLDRIRSVGAEVKLFGRDFDEAKEHARKVAEQANAMFVEDGREPAITGGAGTIAMELTGWSQAIDTMLVPLGNGALLAGVGCWFRSRSPKTRILGVCAEGAPSMALSWRSHQLQSTATVDTIADGIAVRIPVQEALADLEGVVDDIVLVSDDSIKRALKLVHQHLGLVCEPAGVAGVAALISHSSLAKGLVCTPITGGNATRSQLQEWIANIQ